MRVVPVQAVPPVGGGVFHLIAEYRYRVCCVTWPVCSMSVRSDSAESKTVTIHLECPYHGIKPPVVGRLCRAFVALAVAPG